MAKKCVNKEENEKNCFCEYVDCKRHGVCCECLRYHKARDEKPACLR